MATASSTTAPPPPPNPELTTGQLQQIIAGITGGNQRPKIPAPSHFKGERDQLRGWLAQLTVYYRGVGWENSHDADKIAYASSLLRGDALKWITPYVEGRQERTWEGWNEFKDELRTQFGEIDARGAARAKLMNLTQGNRGGTEYWNEFRLVASETGMDDNTLAYHLVAGLKPETQEAWGLDGSDSQDPQYIANWFIRKETKMASIRHMQQRVVKKEKPTSNEASRNKDGTFKPTPIPERRSDPMELDATRRRPRLNLSTEEYQRRMKERLCLKCAKAGHRASACRSQPNSTAGAAWQPRSNRAPWQPKPRVREIQVEENEEPQSGNEESPQ